MGEEEDDEGAVGRHAGAEDADAELDGDEVCGGDIAPGGVCAFEGAGEDGADYGDDAFAGGDMLCQWSNGESSGSNLGTYPPPSAKISTNNCFFWEDICSRQINGSGNRSMKMLMTEFMIPPTKIAEP